MNNYMLYIIYFNKIKKHMNFKKSETAFSLMGFLPALVVQYLMEK